MIGQLQRAFGDCKFPDTCICTIESSYEKTDGRLFYVYDDDQDEFPVKIVMGDPYQLTVNNSNNTVIHLVKTDHCLIPKEVSKCDCLLFNDRKFFFVEIKSTNSGQRKRSRHDAVKQLGATINLLRSNDIDFTAYETKAIICFKTIIPRITQASKNTQRAVFLEDYNISLEEGNEIEF